MLNVKGKWLIVLTCILLVTILMDLRPNIERDSAREVPWPVPDVSQGHSNIEVLANGQLKLTLNHVPLVGISPEMLAWFYQVLPITNVELNGRQIPLYHIFHPREHGQIKILESASDGSKGIGMGALVYRQEWFQEFNSKGQGRVKKLDATGMTVSPEVAGFEFGLIEHKFQATELGSRYTVTSLIGSDAPVLGPVINLFIRYKMFPQEMLDKWIKHQLEEVAYLNYFLRDLYQQKGTGNVYQVER